MPLFEFRCCNCRREFELLVRNQEAPVCPHCRAAELEKLMSAATSHVGAGMLPMASACPPPSHGPCGPGCCRMP
jgi:putative FmdB family regulatory protein